MNLSQKCLYALRALFELARREGRGAVPAADIAAAQDIPRRFLELILKELKQPGWVESFRGPRGGYALAVPAGGLSVGEVVRFVEGPLAPVRCLGEAGDAECSLRGRCAFAGLWERAERALADVYDRTTLADLVADAEAEGPYVHEYII